METTEVNEWGSIHISQQVIAAIASLTAAKVPSVAALGTNIADAAAENWAGHGLITVSMSPLTERRLS